MNPFDAIVLGVAFIAMVMGFGAGLLRSLATILAYVIAVPVALVVTPTVAVWLNARGWIPPEHAPLIVALLPIGVLLVIAIVLGMLLRGAVGKATGGQTMFIDRVLGALLGAVRIGLVAVLLVLVFERIIPAGREPDWLRQSQLRPYLSAAGAQGLRTLPPEATAYLDRLARARGL